MQAYSNPKRYITEQRHGQWIARSVSDKLTMIRNGERVPMGEIIYQGTKVGCAKAIRKHLATCTLIHAMRYIQRHLEYSPANGAACRILENCIDVVSA